MTLTVLNVLRHALTRNYGHIQSLHSLVYQFTHYLHILPHPALLAVVFQTIRC